MNESRRLNIEFDKAIFNEKFFPAFKSKARWLVLYGGAGSGKSVFTAQKLLIRLIKEPGHNFLVVRKVGRTIRHSCFALLRDTIAEWDMTKLFKIRESMDFTFLPNGGQIFTSGLDDVEKLKSVHRVTGVWGEEATEWSLNDLRQTNLRLRGVMPYYKQIVLTFNPIFGTAAHKMFFIEPPPKNSYIEHSTYRDNKFIDDEYRRELEGYADIDSAFHQIYAKGEFAELKGKIYARYKVIPKEQYPVHYQHKYYGLDFGYTNPSVLLDIGYSDPYKLYFKQMIHEAELTNSDLIKRMDELKIDKRQPMYADSSEPDRIAEIADAGYLIYPAQKDVADGIDFCMRFDIFSCDDNIESNREFSTYKWREDAAGNTVDGVPVKKWDHAPDALRYGTYTHLREVLGKTQTSAGSTHDSLFGKSKF
ncbi:MAG: PBSX family phage terminase large subunit [Bacteroidetes bacterium]|nr:PBSX family phage terminase large subunit [Bacteroidota bacterium]